MKTSGDYQPAYFRDTGCHLEPSCLNCSQARCWHDVMDQIGIGGLRAQQRAERDLAVLEWWRSRPELKPGEVARAWGISERTAFRIRRRGRSYPAPERTAAG